jgi:hypothetical protein
VQVLAVQVQSGGGGQPAQGAAGHWVGPLDMVVGVGAALGQQPQHNSSRRCVQPLLVTTTGATHCMCPTHSLGPGSSAVVSRQTDGKRWRVTTAEHRFKKEYRTQMGMGCHTTPWPHMCQTAVHLQGRLPLSHS